MIPAIPSSFRHGRPFDDERQLLGWLLARLRAPSRTSLSFVGVPDDLRTLLGVSIPLLRAQQQHARAVYRLSGLGVAESAYSICRSMLELRAAHAFLLETAPSPERAFLSSIWSLLVVQSPPGRPTREVTKALSAAKSADPALYKTVADRFAKRPFGHCSGMGWTKLVSKYGGNNAAYEYGYLSWHTHVIAATAADVRQQIARNYRTTTFTQFHPEHLMSQDVCLHAINLLHGVWLDFHRVFGPIGKPTRRRA